MVGRINLKKVAIPVLLIFGVLTGFFAYQVSNARFDYDFEKFFPLDDPETHFFFDHRAKFESDNDYLLIALANKGGVFETTFLEDVSDYSKKLAKVPRVQAVVSLTELNEQFLLPTGLTAQRPYLNFDEKNWKRDSTQIFRCEELLNTLIARDGGSLCIFIKHEEYISKKKSDALIEAVNDLTNHYDFDQVYISGRTVGQNYYIKKMNFEMLLYVGLSAVLIVVFLFIAFRSLWGILIPQVVLLSTIVWIVGLMGLFNEPINIILTTLPSVMFVVAMSDVIHLVSRYLDALRTNPDRISAIRIAIREVGLATFLTSLTTSIGFFSLYFVNVEPIRKYGIVLGVGVLIAFVLTFLILPVLFYLFPGPKFIHKQREGHFWKKYLERWFLIVLKRRKTVLIASLLVVCISLAGLFRIQADNYLMDDMRASDPTKEQFNFIDAHYGGIRPFELAVTLKDTTRTFWDSELLRELDTVEAYIESTYGAEIKQSVVQTVKVMNRSSHSGLPEYYTIPEKNSKIRSFQRKLKLAEQGKLYDLLVDSTETVMRISGAVGDIGNQALQAKNKALLSFLKSRNTEHLMDYQLTGTAHLLDKNMSYLSSSLVKGLLVSICIVALIMGLIYRSFSMLIISIIPNIIPLIMVAGIMGYTGINLKTSTAIIFTIAFGIAVDDTIHLLGKFKFELMKGRGKIYALKRSYLTTGKAMILTTLILCSGFLLLMISSFLGTFYMGMLLSLTLLFALVLDLTLLPVLLLLFYHPKKNRK